MVVNAHITSALDGQELDIAIPCPNSAAMCTQAECEAAYDGICPYCTDDNILRNDGVDPMLDDCLAQTLCRIDSPCDVRREYLRADFVTAQFPIAGLEYEGRAVTFSAGCFNCGNLFYDSCPTECPPAGGADGGSGGAGSSIVAPGCGTIVAVDCPLVSTVI